jgi:prophage antirepressor-like protein
MSELKNNLMLFDFKGNQVRVAITAEGVPWFVARDVAEILGYANISKAIEDHCKKAKSLKLLNNNETLLLLEIKDLRSDTKFILESDVYRLVMRSQLDEAEKFQDWVVEDVLPSIRKTGSYSIRPKTALELAREQVVLLERIEQVEHECDCAIATKAEIGSRREATAMNTASQEKKRANRLEAELDRSRQYYTVKRMEMLHHGQKFNWRLLKSTGIEMGIEPIDVFDANYGTVKAYHIDVWREAYAIGDDFDSQNDAA